MWSENKTFLLSTIGLAKSPQYRVTHRFCQAKNTVGEPIEGSFHTESTMFRCRLCNSFQSRIWLSHEYPHFGSTEVRAKLILSLKGSCNLDNWRNLCVASWNLVSASTFVCWSSTYLKKEPRLFADVTGFGRFSCWRFSNISRFEAQDQLFWMSNVISMSGRIGQICFELQSNHEHLYEVSPSYQQKPLG